MYHSFLIHSSANGRSSSRWMSRLLLCPGYCKQCCDEHWDTPVSFPSGFLSVYAQQWDCWIIRQLYFQFFKESPHCLHSGCTSLHSLFSTTSPAFIACRLLDRSHSDWREMVPHSGFDLHFCFQFFESYEHKAKSSDSA